MATKLAPKAYKEDAAFAKALHGDGSKVGIKALLSKDKAASAAAHDGYYRHWKKPGPSLETDADRQARLDDYAELTKNYYNLVTDFYEYGWGSSFHFCTYNKGESFKEAMARHEHYLAYRMNITEGSKVLDVGCGVGGPACRIAHFTGAHVTGLNNNDYQLSKATLQAKRQGLEHQTKFIKGDFMQMDLEDNSFDFVYAIEATVHAPDLAGVYSEMYRVLKPGGVFGIYEWVLTDNYDENNSRHREIAYGIEIGDGIPKMFKYDVALEALQKSGFELMVAKNLADPNAPLPWYYLLTGDWRYVQSFSDFLTFCRTSKLGRWLTIKGTGALETLGIFPKGSKKVTLTLEEAAIHLMDGAKEDLFTPMMLYVCRKPENAKK